MITIFRNKIVNIKIVEILTKKIDEFFLIIFTNY